MNKLTLASPNSGSPIGSWRLRKAIITSAVVAMFCFQALACGSSTAPPATTTSSGAGASGGSTVANGGATSTSSASGGAGGSESAGGGGNTAETIGTVDVYLAAGELNASYGCFFAGDAHSDAQGCSIHRLRVELANSVRLDHQVVVADDPQNGNGVWQPSVSQDGAQLAFTHNIQTTDATVYVKSLPSSQASDIGSAISSTPSGRFVFPNWRGSTDLTLSRPDAIPACYVTIGPDKDSCSGIERWNNLYLADPPASASGNPEIVAGDSGFSFQDSYAHPSKLSLVAGHGKLNAADLTTYPSCNPAAPPPSSIDCSDLKSSPQPSIIDIDNRKVWAFALQTTEEKYKQGNQALALAGCAHLAWSLDGTRLLCTEQGTTEMKTLGEQGRIFVFNFDETVDVDNQLTTKDASPLFTHRLAEQVWTLQGNDQCDVFHHKYAEWCGHDGFIVATIGCACETTECIAAAGGNTKVIGDRVFLIDIRSPESPRYFDLTTELELATGKQASSMTSFTATCAGFVAAD